MSDIRLINANALKEEIENLIGYSLSYEAILNAIDNAPTVIINDKSLEIARKSLKLGFRVGKAEGKLERPKGEWIWSDNRWGLGNYLCNKCNHYAHDKSNFCPNCGADMRKGGAE